MTARTAPNPDEVEMSIFGPGVGECVVLHLGEGKWCIVDSCVDPETGNPVALDYLREIGVPLESIACVVITHWHDDHIRGIAEIVHAAPSAQVVCSAALRCQEFMSAIGASVIEYMRDAGATEMRRVFNHLLARPTGSPIAMPFWVKAGSIVFRSSIGTIEALSPSDGVYAKFLQEIGNLIPHVRETALRAVAQGPNEIAVVLFVESGGVRLLLGSDLECGNSAHTGWQAVISSPTRPANNAQVLKVPHHGSEGADHPLAWSSLLVADPYAVLTPFRRSGIPKDSDIVRIKSRTPWLFGTARSQRKKPSRRASAVEKMIRRSSKDLHETVGEMGHVRIRSPRTNPSFHVQLFGAAIAL